MRSRNTYITIFVILWLLVFNYESIRFFYLNPLFKSQLPKVKFLFPPAGWIMFFQVEDEFGYAEIYGTKDGIPDLIDPHNIIETKTILYDNIHRNILSTVLAGEYQKPFCRFLDRKFPYYDNFLVTAVYYPSLTKTPEKRYKKIIYTCEQK